MEKKDNTHTQVSCSNAMKDLLLDPGNTVRIATSYDAIEKVFHQIMLDVTAGGDDEKSLQVMKGLNHAKNVLLLFRQEGEIDLKASQR